MTGVSLFPEKTELPGRHVDTTTLRGWLSRRIDPAAFLQSMLIVCLILVVWPANLGGRFGLVMVAGPSMEPTYDLGDAVFTWDEPVEVGDVILFRVPDGDFGERNAVIHRVVDGDPSAWVTRGDNSDFDDPWTPSQENVVGVAKVRIPLGGRVLALMKSWLVIAIIGGVAALLLFWPDPEEEEGRGRHKPEREVVSLRLGDL